MIYRARHISENGNWKALGVLFPQEKFVTFGQRVVLDPLKLALEKELQKLGYKIGQCFNEDSVERDYLAVLERRGIKPSGR